MSADAGVSLRQLLMGFAEVPVSSDRPVFGLAGDSRQVKRGDLFLAVRGLHHHGLDFLSTVRAAGAAAVAWEPPYVGNLSDSSLPLVAVENLYHKLGLIANRFHGKPSRALNVVGVTGTDGKSSCTHFIAQALSTEGRACGLLGTLGYGVYGRLTPASHTTPDAVTLQRLLAQLHAQGVRNVAMEVSSHALAQKRVAGVTFAAAVLTNLTRDHLDFHGNLDAYAAAKAQLFLEYQPRHSVLNLDDPFGRSLATRLPEGVDAVGYGLGVRQVESAFVWGKDVEILSPFGLRLRVVSSWGEGTLHADLLGRFNVHNLLATLATLLVLDIPFQRALQRVSRVSIVPGRMERFGGEGCPLAVVDYAHTPYALEQVLRALREHARGRLWCVFGCGGDRDPGKRPEMGAVAERSADRVILTDDNPRTEDPDKVIQGILSGMRHPQGVEVVRNRADAIYRALTQATDEDIVLIAGKGHEDYQVLGIEKVPFSDSAVVRQCLEIAA